MTKLRCKKEFGIWYYTKTLPNDQNELDGPLYELYDEAGAFVMTFGWYRAMKYFVETGVII